MLRAILSAVLFTCSIAFFSCKKEVPYTIPEDKMVRIFADLTLADDIVREYTVDERDSLSKVLLESILKIHKISQSQLDSNLYLYQTNFEKYEKVLEELGSIYKSKYENGQSK